MRREAELFSATFHTTASWSYKNGHLCITRAQIKIVLNFGIWNEFAEQIMLSGFKFLIEWRIVYQLSVLWGQVWKIVFCVQLLICEFLPFKNLFWPLPRDLDWISSDRDFEVNMDGAVVEPV